jgi:hypothetical protein
VILVHLVAWGIIQASTLILFPNAVVPRARVLERTARFDVVLAVKLLDRSNSTWFGHFGT